jgi:hypothetical protein
MTEDVKLSIDEELNAVKEPNEPIVSNEELNDVKEPILSSEESENEPIVSNEELNDVKEPILSSEESENEPILSSEEIQANLISFRSLILANIKTPSYNLSPEQIEWINKFIEASPEVFDIILKDILLITADGKIDYHDIPLLIKVITDVYNSRAITRNMANSQNIIAFVKFTLDVILDSNYIDLSEIDKTVIRSLIDSSISLLSMNVGSNANRQSFLVSGYMFISKLASCFSTK